MGTSSGVALGLLGAGLVVYLLAKDKDRSDALGPPRLAPPPPSGVPEAPGLHAHMSTDHGKFAAELQFQPGARQRQPLSWSRPRPPPPRTSAPAAQWPQSVAPHSMMLPGARISARPPYPPPPYPSVSPYGTYPGHSGPERQHAPGPMGAPLAFAPTPGWGQRSTARPQPPQMSAECSNWRTATAADVKRDGVLATYQSMLKQSESLPPRIEGHNGRLWKFQTVTPQSDPSFEFSPGISKDVRGWVCDGAPNPVE